jgi:hypothetical protein
MNRRSIATATIIAALAMFASTPPSFGAAANVMVANVWTGPTGGGVNQVFGRVTVCIPGTSTCQQIGGLVIDTGSFGLRIFSQAFKFLLPSEMSGPDRVAECAAFGSANTWGRVAMADVIMAGEPKIHNLPIQVINHAWPVPGVGHANCGNGAPLAQNPQQFNFNGILGVGMLPADGDFTRYFACNSSSCTPASAPAQSLQVQNPVAMLSTDNNGVMLNLPPLASTGAWWASGRLVFGINTRPDNQIPARFKEFTADANLNFTTTYNGVPNPSSFLDSGSNGFFFDDPAIQTCLGGWYCPGDLMGFNATTTGSDGRSSTVESFLLDDATILFATGNSAFSDLGFDIPGIFDWGLPFFFGRRIFVAIAGKSVAGVSEPAPFWAFR